MSAENGQAGLDVPSGTLPPEDVDLPGAQRTEGRRRRKPTPADRDRVLVMRLFRGLVASGVAEWIVLESGQVRLKCASGAIFDLGPEFVTRIA